MCREAAERSYLITLSNDEGEIQKIVVRTSCTHDMQQFVSSLQDLKIKNPVIIDMEDRTSDLPNIIETS